MDRPKLTKEIEAAQILKRFHIWKKDNKKKLNTLIDSYTEVIQEYEDKIEDVCNDYSRREAIEWQKYLKVKYPEGTYGNL